MWTTDVFLRSSLQCVVVFRVNPGRFPLHCKGGRKLHYVIITSLPWKQAGLYSVGVDQTSPQQNKIFAISNCPDVISDLIGAS